MGGELRESGSGGFSVPTRITMAARMSGNLCLCSYDISDINQDIADAKHGDTIKPVLRINGDRGQIPATQF